MLFLHYHPWIRSIC